MVNRIAAILIVDNGRYSSKLLADFLTRAGYLVLTASCGAHALAMLFSEQDIDLLISDVRMAGIDGVELARLFRTAKPWLPILFLSGSLYDLPLAVPDAVLVRRPCALEHIVTTVKDLLKTAKELGN